jgi:hypothetical protein
VDVMWPAARITLAMLPVAALCLMLYGCFG